MRNVEIMLAEGATLKVVERKCEFIAMLVDGDGEIIENKIDHETWTFSEIGVSAKDAIGALDDLCEEYLEEI